MSDAGVDPRVTHCRRAHVVTAFVRHEGDLLLVRREADPPFVRREGDASSTSDRWDGVSQVLNEAPSEPVAVARDALRAHVGIENATFVRQGAPVVGATPGSTGDTDSAPDDRIVRPLLFGVDARTGQPSESVADVAWLPAPAIRAEPTAPGLWRAYRQVAPTVATVAEDGVLAPRDVEAVAERHRRHAAWDSVADR